MRYVDEVDDFGHVRSLLHQGPASWPELSLYLERWLDKTSFLNVVMPYVRDHIRSWPRGSHAIPRRWKHWMLLGHEVLPVHCVHALSFANMKRPAGGEIGAKTWKLECLQGLEYIDLSNTRIKSSSLSYMLGGADRLKKLRALELNDNPHLFSNNSAPNFLTEPRAKRLDVLGLKKCALTHKHIGHLLDLECMAHVQMLKLSDNPLKTKGLEKLTGTKLPALTSIDLHRTHFDQRSLKALRQASFLPRLVWLSFSVEQSSPAIKKALLAFIKNPALANLKALYITAPPYHDDLAVEIARQSHFKDLNTLVLRRSFGPKIRDFADLDDRLRSLGLKDMSKQGVEALVTSPHLSDEVKSHWYMLLEDPNEL